MNTNRTSGRLDICARAIDAIHHGAGTSGNTSLLRTQDIILRDGRPARVPFISGNSIKHMIRESGARFALQAMGVADGSLPKPVVDLLFSGGALSKIGSAVDLAGARRLAELFPLLSLCGYSAGNVMVPSKIRVDNLHLACEENEWRMPSGIAALPQAQLRAGALRSTEFGTRHESSRRPHVARLLTAGESQRLEQQVSAALAEQHADKRDSAQMIYDYETIKPGAVFWGAIHLDEVTDMELGALQSALSTACEGTDANGSLIYRIGAKSSIGCGRVAIDFTGLLREPVRSPDFTVSTQIARFGASGKVDFDAYVGHLRDRREEILRALEEAVA